MIRKQYILKQKYTMEGSLHRGPYLLSGPKDCPTGLSGLPWQDWDIHLALAVSLSSTQAAMLCQFIDWDDQKEPGNITLMVHKMATHVTFDCFPLCLLGVIGSVPVWSRRTPPKIGFTTTFNQISWKALDREIWKCRVLNEAISSHFIS